MGNKKNDFYEKIMDKIYDLTKKGELEEALKIVEEEIVSPYIPADYLNDFERLYTELKKAVTAMSMEKKYAGMTKLEIMSQIFKKNTVNMNAFTFFLSRYVYEMEQIDAHFFNTIFLSSSVSMFEKIFILEQFKFADVNFTFEFYNQNSNKNFCVNSMSDFEMSNAQYYASVEKKIKSALLKWPSSITLALDLLKMIYEYYFIGVPSFSEEELAFQLTKYITESFEPKNVQASSFHNWLELIAFNKKIKN